MSIFKQKHVVLFIKAILNGKHVQDRRGLIMFGSLFIEELCRDLRVDPDLENITEEEVEDNLLELMNLVFISPFEKWVGSYIELKDQFDFKKLENALNILARFVAIVDPTEEENFLWKRGLKVLSTNFLHTTELVQGAVFLALRGNIGCGILMRTALELWLHGMLLEHLRNPKFREQVARAGSDMSKRDSLTWFLKLLREESNCSGKSIEETIEDHIDIKIIVMTKRNEIKKHVNKKHEIDWLDRWGCFEPIPKASEDIFRLWNYFSEEVHGKSDALLSRIFSLRFLKETMGLIDLFLVGVINTLNNLASERLYEVDHSESIKDERVEEIQKLFRWEGVVKSINESELSFAKEALKRLER